MAGLGELLVHRRAVFGTEARFLFTFVEGDAFVIDPNTMAMVARGWIDEPEVLVLTNHRTMNDIAAGRFDAAHPNEEHLFLWAGEAEAMHTLERALSGGTSLLGIRTGGA